MENNPTWQNVTDIFQRKVRARDVVREIENRDGPVSREREDLIHDNAGRIENILDREFPEQTIPIKATIREAIDIFYKVNAGGVALTDAELALAQISGYWPQARDQFKAKLARLRADGFDFKLDFIVFVLLGCLFHLGSDMRKLHADENEAALRKAWQQLDERVLDYVVNLVRTHAYVDHSDEINSVYALVPIIVYCFGKGTEHLSDSEIRKVVKWFYYSQIRTRYVSQLPQKLDRDLRVVQSSSSPFDDLLRTIVEEQGPLEIRASEFEGRAIQHPLFSMMRWYLKSRGAVCFTTGMSIRRNMGEKYQLENDHIFAFSRLRDAGYGMGNQIKYALAQEFTNRALLTQVANRKKSAKDAETYLRDVKKRFPNALTLQCIPEDEALWQVERYEDFLKARREKLADNISRFLTSITATEETALPASVEDLIREGESEELEYKSTLRWDLEKKSVSKVMEHAIVKAVAAFANSRLGGTLIIGVSDDGEVLGLDHDYVSLEGNRDEFEVHLRNLLTHHFGAALVTTRVKVSFPAPSGREVCKIDVAPASQPVFIEMVDKNGQRAERFYVRSGNTSREFSPSEMSAYVKERFK